MEVKFTKDNILQLNNNKINKNNRQEKIKIFKKKVLN